MANVIRLVLTVVFGLLWKWVYAYTDYSVIVLLGSILTLCVCCCRAGGDPTGEWSWERYFRCLRRCRTALIVLIIALILIGFFWPVIEGGPAPSGAALVALIVGAIGSVVAIRLICCLYDQ